MKSKDWFAYMHSSLVKGTGFKRRTYYSFLLLYYLVSLLCLKHPSLLCPFWLAVLCSRAAMEEFPPLVIHGILFTPCWCSHPHSLPCTSLKSVSFLSPPGIPWASTPHRRHCILDPLPSANSCAITSFAFSKFYVVQGHGSPLRLSAYSLHSWVFAFPVVWGGFREKTFFCYLEIISLFLETMVTYLLGQWKYMDNDHQFHSN